MVLLKMAARPASSEKRMMEAPMRFPSESWGVFWKVEVKPTKSSGVDVARPKNMTPIKNSLMWKSLASLETVETSRSAERTRR